MSILIKGWYEEPTLFYIYNKQKEMYTLGIPKRDYRRATQVLGYESQPQIPFEATLQDDGFYIFSFPEVEDEYDFRKVVNKLKGEGVRVIGADAQLTERNIMKLANLITEAPTLAEIEEPKWLNKLKRTYETWQVTQYKDDRNKWEMFNEDIKELIEQWEDELDIEKKEREKTQDIPGFGGTLGALDNIGLDRRSLAEQKLRKLIRKTIKK